MAKKRAKKPIDPSKPLKNPKHEMIAREIASGSTQIDAYRKYHPKAKESSVMACASRAVEMHGINQRALKLLESVGLTEEKLANTLNKHVDSMTESISMDATKTGFKLLGYGQEQRQAETSYNPVQINIIIEDSKPETVVPQGIQSEED